MTGKKLFALLLLWATFQVPAALAQVTQFTSNPAMPVTGQPFTVTVTTSATFPDPLTVSYNIYGPRPQNVQLSSGTLSITNHTGTIPIPAVPAVGLYFIGLSGALADQGEITVFGPNQGADAVLLGQYAFYLTGQEKTLQGGMESAAMAGVFNADGQGHITSGMLDKNSGAGYVQAKDITGTYQLDISGKGYATLNSSAGSYTFAFYSEIPLPTPNLEANVVSTAGTLLNAIGRIGITDPFFQPSTYTFTLGGEQSPATSPLFGAGTLTFGQSTVTVQYQQIVNGAATNVTGLTGTYTPPDPASQRFTFSLAAPGGTSSHFVVYQGGFSTGILFFLSTDPHSSSPLLIGTNVRFY